MARRWFGLPFGTERTDTNASNYLNDLRAVSFGRRGRIAATLKSVIGESNRWRKAGLNWFPTHAHAQRFMHPHFAINQGSFRAAFATQTVVSRTQKVSP